eukprot:4929266-Lingulodinium_polyedra.AAC.1
MPSSLGPGGPPPGPHRLIRSRYVRSSMATPPCQLRAPPVLPGATGEKMLPHPRFSSNLQASITALGPTWCSWMTKTLAVAS